MLTGLFGFSLLLIALALVVALYVPRPGGKTPKIRFSELWKFRGKVSRGAYITVGVIAFAIKHNIDRAVAGLVFHRPFSIFNYWIPPIDALRVSSLSGDEAVFLMTMVVISLPFVWLGLAMTVRRLRSSGLPLWLVALFFVPVINVLFFLILALIREAGEETLPRTSMNRTLPIPGSMIGSALVAVIAMGAIGALVTYIGVEKMGVYGIGVFVALPFCLGLGAVMIYTYKEPRSMRSCILVSLTAVGLIALALFTVAIEGLICILMALPIAVPLALLGGIVGYFIQRRRDLSARAPSLTMLMVLLPMGFMTIETTVSVEPELSIVTTTTRIQASPSEVWPHLIAFPDLPESRFWLFRAGVAHPIRATINGEGVGALRECLFSTGTFVERIDGWEKDKRLAFSVISGAEAMHELTPYDIHPRHLDGYFNPVRAEFTLAANPDGSTTLEGKSWYRNSMWPGPYWRLWSDKILHDVHRSVFDHLKTLSERGR